MTGRPLRRISGEPSLPLPANSWLGSIPAVRQLVEQGLELGALTVIVGENGAGKSTLTEAVAMAFGMSSEGGSTGARHSTRPSESTLHQHLRLVRGVAGARWASSCGRKPCTASTAILEDNPPLNGPPDPRFHEMSHGESFLTVLAARFGSPGLYVLDEPEAALSFQSTLALIDVPQLRQSEWPAGRCGQSCCRTTSSRRLSVVVWPGLARAHFHQHVFVRPVGVPDEIGWFESLHWSGAPGGDAATLEELCARLQQHFPS